MTKKLLLLSALMLMLTSCEGTLDDIFGEWSRPTQKTPDSTDSQKENPIAVTGVTIDQTTLSLVIGTSGQLVATVAPADAADKSVAWTSSNAAVATVDSNGNVTAVAAGTATITVTTTDGAKTSTCAVTVTEKSATVSFATSSIGKTLGDAEFTNTLTNTGDGTVTYESSNTAVAEVNANTGSVNIKGNGETVITATVTDTENFTYATKKASYTLGVGTSTMTVTATKYSAPYDGNAHGITVNAPDGATIKYGTTEGSYTLAVSPTYADAGTHTVYYEVTKTGYITVTNSALVEISKIAGTISFANDSENKLTSDAAFTNTLTNTGDGEVTYSSSDTSVATVNASTGLVTIKAVGSTTITATVTDGTNYTYATKTAQYTLKVNGLGKPSDYNNGGDPF